VRAIKPSIGTAWQLLVADRSPVSPDNHEASDGSAKSYQRNDFANAERLSLSPIMEKDNSIG
jgi:hypothetical protein